MFAQPTLLNYTRWSIYDSGCCMSRLARLEATGVLHHVMGQDIEKKKIFLCSPFLNRLY